MRLFGRELTIRSIQGHFIGRVPAGSLSETTSRTGMPCYISALFDHPVEGGEEIQRSVNTLEGLA